MKLFLVEDCPLIREGINVLCIAEGWEVVAESDTAEEAIQLLPSAKPDIILLDVGLPDADGFTFARHARAVVPTARILVLSGYLNQYVLSQCETLSVEGFADKLSTLSADLTRALRTIAAGHTFFSASYLAAKRRWLADPCSISKRLSEREVQVMLLVARGLTDEEIARALNITASTAATHRGRVMRNLDLPSTPKLIIHAVNQGYGYLH